MESTRLDLGTKCTIVRVEELQTQLEDLLQSGTHIEIDASKLEQCDTAALQLLASFHQALKAEGRELSWQKPSAQTLAAAALLGLTAAIGLNG